MAGELILIVDDNPTNLKLVKLLLSIEGYEIHTAINADEVITALKNIHPKMILMDLQLPGKNGLILSRELKSDQKFQDICIVALTAYAMKGDKEKALAAGCDGFLTKPISAISFPGDIAKYLAEHSALPNEEK
jgi:two-component system cell cycle response regulator DivK